MQKWGVGCLWLGGVYCQPGICYLQGWFGHIGDGKSVSIWGDKWIPKPSFYAIQTPCRMLDTDAKVCELIEPTTSRWNIPLIREVFWEDEAELISGLPVSKLKGKTK